MKDIRSLPNLLDGFYPCPAPGQEYWNFKIPVHQLIVEGPNTKKLIKLECAKLLLESVSVLIKNKPPELSSSRVVAIISDPNFFSSEITVFFDEDYFKTFFYRDNEDQIWTPLPDKRSFLKEWGLADKFEFAERGFEEFMPGDYGDYSGEVWIVGEA